MKEQTLTRISFGSFVKLYAAISLAIGAILGVLALIIALLGGDVYSNLGTIEFTGIVAGIINLFLMPIITAITGALFAIIAFLPFKLYLKITHGIKLTFETTE